MTQKLTQLQQTLGAALGEKLTASDIAFGELTIQTKAEDAKPVCARLRDDFAFNQLIDLCGVDYSQYGMDEWRTDSATGTGFSRGFNANTHGRGDSHDDSYGEPDRAATNTGGQAKHPARYAVVYHLMSLAQNLRIRLKAWCRDDDFPLISSVVDLWPAADWFEREAFDLFGIMFTGHNDLRRILTDYGFVGHPFRKDFPLSGNVEMRYDAAKGRVVYEPVSIEPRVLVPRVVRAARKPGQRQDTDNA